MFKSQDNKLSENCVETFFCENDLLTPNDPKWPHLKNETISFVEGLKLYDVHESRDPAM